MPITIVATAQPDDYAVSVAITGLTVGKTYTLERQLQGSWAAMRTWTAVSYSEYWEDVTVPFGIPVTYRIGAVISGTVSISWSSVKPADVPMFDPNEGAWPVLRVANDASVPLIRLPVTDYSADFGYRTQTLPILGSAYPVVASDVMQAKTGTIVFLTPDVGWRSRLLAALRPGRVLHLRAPCVDGLGDLYFRAINVSESVPLNARPLLRAWQVDFQQVARPSGYGLVEWETGRTWADVEAVGTWADVLAKWPTWADVLGQPQQQQAARTAVAVDGGSW